MEFLSTLLAARDCSTDESADSAPPPKANTSKGQATAPQASHSDSGPSKDPMKAHYDMAGLINQCGEAYAELAKILFANMLSRKFKFAGISDKHLMKRAGRPRGNFLALRASA